MNNREIEESLKRAAGKITPDVMDGVLKRIETERDAVVPMNMSVKRRKRSVWMPVLAAAAALMLVVNVGMFLHYHNPKGQEVVELTPHTQTEDGAQLIQQIVQMDPGFTPEKLSAYSVDELNTILRATQARQEQAPVNTEPEEELEAVDTAEDEMLVEGGQTENEIMAVDGLISDNGYDQDEITASGTISDNTVSNPAPEDDPQPAQRDDGNAEDTMLTEDGAFAAVLKDAGVEKESVIHSVIDSVIHTSYGVLYTIDFETDKFSYHYRITEYGTVLSAGRELIEDKETE